MMRASFVSLLVTLLIAGCGNDDSSDDLAEQFRANTADGSRIDHGDWQQVLNDYLVPNYARLNRVDYAGLATAGTGQLDRYLTAMSAVDPEMHPADEQMAYWINVYNALTVRRIVEDWPVESILELGDSALARGPWGDPAITVNGHTLSLDDIEHRILRVIWEEPRIHFAVNCASVGCPDLQPIAFTGANLESQLRLGARNYLASPRGVVREGDALLVSSLFQWYADDFGDSPEAVLDRLAEYADQDTAKRLRSHDGPLRYAYDWSLNATP
ncbi:MAG: DUF547 domain-containing protein [Pseudomonadota bacterium]